ncbi:MAG TPA: hypothetical protein VJG64_04185 [Candidatus Paceibacterota bacterium]
MADISARAGGYWLLATQGDPLGAKTLGVYLLNPTKLVYVVWFRRKHPVIPWNLVPIAEYGTEPYIIDGALTSNFRSVKDVYKFGSDSEVREAVLNARITIKGTSILD